MDSELLFPKMPTIRTARIFLALAVFMGILSGASGGLVYCDAVAAVVGSIALLSLPEPGVGRIIRNSVLLGIASLIGSAALVYLIVGNLRLYCIGALTPAICCLAICLSIYKLRSRGFTVTLVTVILLVMLALSTLAGWLDAGAALSLSSVKELLTGFEATLREMFDQTMLLQTGEDTTALLDDATLDRMIRIVEFLFPFLLYVFYFVIAYIVTGLIRRILLCYTLGRRSLSGWLLIPSKISCIFYMIATVFCIFSLNFLFSQDFFGTGAGGVICLTSIAVLLLTLPACFAIGVRRTVFLFRTHRRFGFMGILCAVFIGMFIPFFIFFYFGFTGAYHAVFDPIIAKKMRDFNSPGGDDSSDRS